MGPVESAVESICPHLRKGNLVILESTVPPTTCRKFIKPLIEKLTGLKVPSEIMLAHCPDRILPGDIFREIVENDRLIGGMDEASTNAAAECYTAFVKGTLHRTDDVSAELSKLMENTYRDVKVALAGPASNFVQAILWALVFVGLAAAGIDETFFIKMAQGGVLVNLVMWAFNLFPLPPLDGGRVLAGLLPNGPAQNFLARIEPFGFFIVMGLVLAGIVSTFWLRPLMDVGYAAINLFISPLVALLR